AVGDLDNDGRPDLVISHVNEPVTVLRHTGTPHHWVGFHLWGSEHRDIVGARVSVQVGGRTLTRYAKGGGSYLSAPDPRILVGLGTDTRVEKVTVEWPTGEPRTQTFTPPSVDRYWDIRQGQ